MILLVMKCELQTIWLSREVTRGEIFDDSHHKGADGTYSGPKAVEVMAIGGPKKRRFFGYGAHGVVAFRSKHQYSQAHCIFTQQDVENTVTWVTKELRQEFRQEQQQMEQQSMEQMQKMMEHIVALRDLISAR